MRRETNVAAPSAVSGRTIAKFVPAVARGRVYGPATEKQHAGQPAESADSLLLTEVIIDLL